MTQTSPEMSQILMIARSIAGQTGHTMLARLVEALSQHLNTTFAIVAYGEGTPRSHARALYAMRGQTAAEGIRYALDGTPCARVYEGETLTIPCGIADLYPREAGLEGYIGIPLRGTDGTVAGHLAVFSDTPITQSEVATAITTIFALRAEAELRRLTVEAERKRLIADLSRLNTRLQRGYADLRRENAQRTGLMGLIAHDLRRPLTAMLSQAELGLARCAAATPDIARIETAFTKVVANADRMSHLIDATLERARAEGEALTLDPHACDLASLVRVAAEANRDDAARKSITLTVAPGPAIPAELDETLVISAIDNLISNAVKYTGPGGAVDVTLDTTPDTATIAVTDTGQGLTPDDLDRAFGRFQTLSARPTGGESSTGLGLANVREIAQAHGGTVRAESDGPGTGSRFSLTLPLPVPAKSPARPA